MGPSHITDKELRKELKGGRFKVKGRGREEMIVLLEEDDRNQKKLGGGKEEAIRSEERMEGRGMGGGI